MTATPPPAMCPDCKFHSPHHRPDCPRVVLEEAAGDPEEFASPRADKAERTAAQIMIEQAERPFDERDHPSNCPDCGGCGADDGSVHGPNCRWRCKQIKMGVQCVRTKNIDGSLHDCLFNVEEVIAAVGYPGGAEFVSEPVLFKGSLADPDAKQSEVNIIGVAEDEPPPQVDHPDHYNAGGIECIEAIRAALTAEEFAGFCKGNAMKYIWRERHKNRAIDMQKAQWYLTKLVEVES